jgi:hypothetical protein
MKKSYTLLPLICGLLYIITTSELPGSNLGTTARTNCTGSGCHAASSAATSITSLTLVDQANSQTVTSYKAGHVYTLTLKGSNTGNLPKFGFQLQASAGTYSAPGSGEVVFQSKMLTHGSSPIAAVSNVYTATATWTAPAAGTGTVTFTGIINAVDGTGTSSNDQPGSQKAFTYTESTTAAAVSIIPVGSIRLYPNPATTHVNLDLVDAAAGSYELNVYNSVGAKVLAQQPAVSKSSQTISLDVSGLAAGTYFLSINRDGGSLLKTFVKN